MAGLGLLDMVWGDLGQQMNLLNTVEQVEVEQSLLDLFAAATGSAKATGGAINFAAVDGVNKAIPLS